MGKYTLVKANFSHQRVNYCCWWANKLESQEDASASQSQITNCYLSSELAW